MSPSLNQDKRIELKYLLDAPLAHRVKEWARQHLGVDPHCCETLVDSYDVHTLYLDTSEFDLYHRSGVAGSTKHRIRRYSQEGTLWLECKRKRKDVVRKNRTAVPENDVLERLSCDSSPTDASWCGDWFAQRIAHRRLRPAVQVHYRRFARTSTLDNESLRLTVDSHLQTSRISGWEDSLVNSRANELPRRDVSSVQILELKFHNHMPLLFKELLMQFSLPASGFSKYRSSLDAWGLAAAAGQFPSSSHAALTTAQIPQEFLAQDCPAERMAERACCSCPGERLSDA